MNIYVFLNKKVIHAEKAFNKLGGTYFKGTHINTLGYMCVPLIS
jgi:hypothetical protein